MAVTSPSPEEVLIAPPPKFNKNKGQEKFLNEVDNYLEDIFHSFGELNVSIRNGWLIDQQRIISLTADKIFANNIITDNLALGSDENITLDGTSDLITVKDDSDTTRVRIGKLSGTTNDWGIEVSDASGTVTLKSGAATFIDGVFISNATITGVKIADGEIGNTKITDLAVDTGKVAGNAIDENKRINVYSQTDSRSSTNIVAGGVNQHTHSFTHNLGTKVVVVASYDTLTNNADVLHIHTIRNQGTSGFTVENTVYNTSASTQSYSYTLRVDYW